MGNSEFTHGWHTLMGDAPGVSTEMHYYRIGSDIGKPKVYLQAALHADEQPGILVLHHLLNALAVAEQAGQLNARFIVFPLVNPLGLQDIQFGQHQGRYDRSKGVNHNRAWPNLFTFIENTIAAQLGDDPQANQAVVRTAVHAWLQEQQPLSAVDQQRLFAMQEAYDADMIFDLHCDEDALNHIFISPNLMPEYQDLANWVGSAATLTAHDSGGGSFDEVWTLLWHNLVQAYPSHPFPAPPLSATLEYRGNFQTFDSINKQDADNLMGFFRARGLIAGRQDAPPSKAPDAQPLDAMQNLRAPHPGLVAYRRELGDKIKKGDIIAEIIPLQGEHGFLHRAPLIAETDGLLFSRRVDKYVWTGCTVAKVAGHEPLASRKGYLLQD